MKEVRTNVERKVNSNTRGSYDEQVRRLELTSDIFFGVVLEDKKVCEEFLRILIGREIRVNQVKYQFSIRQLNHHSVILDIWAEELSGERINIEIHPQSGEDRVRRMRYNFASIDTRTLNVSEDYSNIPDILGIYITKGDFLKTGKGINQIVRHVLDTDVEVPNGIEEYYINLKREGNTPEQTALFRYIMCSDGVEESEIFPELVKRVKFLKEEKGGSEYMCEIMDAIKEEGREEGREGGLLEKEIGLIRFNHARNLTANLIADFMGLEITFVEKVISLIDRYVKDSDIELANKIKH